MTDPDKRRELWRKGDDYIYLNQLYGFDYIGICCDGRAFEMEPRTWHQLHTWQMEMFDRQCALFGAFASQKNARQIHSEHTANDKEQP